MIHPDFHLPVQVQAEVVGDDPDEQVARTIQLMRGYVLEDLNDPLIKEAAAGLGGPGDRETAEAVWSRVKELMRFSDDQGIASRAGSGLASLEYPVVEVLIRPRDVLELSSGGPVTGDCDDFSMLTAALLEANGIRCSFVTAAADPESERYSHVYVVAHLEDGERFPLDASHGEYPGWEVPSSRKREWPLGAGRMMLLLVAIAAVCYLAAGYGGGEEDG